ncbi:MULTISPECIES: bifunctional helix-turn-helix transcriptional regulator/GNAT family N-acetyltransferase [unclassified Streptomyces]|uniref:bifunctional helix-turn-helix transcriptional regulator/GNAT family N-acetyltransferase n=1 Tax=unclassified Streptomyces TaxID=2593676 RepID=UPI0003664E40|nr:bifunctional helix-turn-helix transcriptional regulator/GNAT family N-acetyltransferase [Streptomyces sp. BoleA5]MYX33966.1 GNAT family N-acetyltransferase [Streptomyces sp. SID8377]
MTVQEIRAFNRFYTNLIGALDYSRHLHTPYTLTEARVLYELAHAAGGGLDAADLRTALSVDAGQLSRMLAAFEERGLVTRAPSPRDARRQRVEPTPDGREAARLLEDRSREAVASMVSGLAPKDRARLTQAMRTVRDVLGGAAAKAPPGARVRLREPRPGDLGWVVQRNAEVYAEEYGWNAEYETLVARIVAGGHERAWIAELDGERAGCVFCVRDDAPGTARLRLLLVDPAARGHGIGRRLVEACVAHARAAGHRELVLWTNDVLVSARRIYEAAGFELVGEKPHRSFGRDLVGQDWRLVL